MQGTITICLVKTIIFNLIPVSIAKYSQEAEFLRAYLRNQSNIYAHPLWKENPTTHSRHITQS